MSKKRIFITGESGVIPQAIQALCKASNKYEVINSNLNPDLNGLRLHQSFKVRHPEIDFTNDKIIEEAFRKTQPEIVIHSGAYVGTDYCASSKDEAVRSNVYGTQKIVNLCNEYGCKLIYFSTTAIFDPKAYGRHKYMTGQTRIDPQTLYGITKYAGELIVKNLCKTDFTIVRPVFGFGDYPDDLHSALTKYIYSIMNGNPLTILLNRKIGKNYFRVENIAQIVMNIIDQDYFGSSILNIGENYDLRKNWDVIDEIIEMKLGKFDNSKITFVPGKDYLHWHNIDNAKLKKLGLYQNLPITFEKGIEMTIKSVKENLDKKPYWI